MYEHKIKVVNVKYWGGSNLVYIGRICGKYKGSVLGNPFKNGTREENIKNYRVWLWNEYKKGGEVKKEIDRLVEIVRNGGEIRLGCWCKPKACHGDIVRKCILYLLSL